MTDNTDILIVGLADKLEPVRPLRQRTGMARAVATLAVGALVMVVGFGLRFDILAGRPDPMFLISSSLFLVLALASAWAAIDTARPYVGSRRDGWWWTALMAATLPAGAVSLAVSDWAHGTPVTLDRDGFLCVILGVVIGLLTATTMVLWLRRGAPSNPGRAGFLTGVTAGAAGIFAVSLYCPHSDLLHIGIWHGAAVIVMGLASKAILPQLLRW